MKRFDFEVGSIGPDKGNKHRESRTTKNHSLSSMNNDGGEREREGMI